MRPALELRVDSEQTDDVASGHDDAEDSPLYQALIAFAPHQASPVGLVEMSVRRASMSLQRQSLCAAPATLDGGQVLVDVARSASSV